MLLSVLKAFYFLIAFIFFKFILILIFTLIIYLKYLVFIIINLHLLILKYNLAAFKVLSTCLIFFYIVFFTFI